MGNSRDGARARAQAWAASRGPCTGATMGYSPGRSRPAASGFPVSAGWAATGRGLDSGGLSW